MKAIGQLISAILNPVKWIRERRAKLALKHELGEIRNSVRRQLEQIDLKVSLIVSGLEDEGAYPIPRKPLRQGCREDCEFCERGLLHSGEKPPEYRQALDDLGLS